MFISSQPHSGERIQQLRGAIFLGNGSGVNLSNDFGIEFSSLLIKFFVHQFVDNVTVPNALS
jgi:hypothetical protein